MSKTHQQQSGIPNKVEPISSQTAEESTAVTPAHCIKSTAVPSESTVAVSGESATNHSSAAHENVAEAATDANSQPTDAPDTGSVSEAVQAASNQPNGPLDANPSSDVMSDTSQLPIVEQNSNPAESASSFNCILSMTQEETDELTKVFSSLRMKGIASDLCNLVNDCCLQNNIRPSTLIRLFVSLQETKHNFTVQNIISRSGIPTTLLTSTFDKDKVRCDIIDDLLSLKWQGQFKNLFLSGPPGVGKTLAAVNIARRAAELKGYSVLFVDSTSLLHELRYGHHERIMERVSKAKILILDDVGKEELFDGNTLMFYRVLHSRMNKNLSTIITASVPVSQWGQRFDDPVQFSGVVNKLLSQTKKVKFTGTSFYIEQTLKLNQP